MSLLPRVLPLTALGLAALLGLKTVGLVRAAVAAADTSASASAPAPAVNPPVAVPAAPQPARPGPEPEISAAERGLLVDLRKRRAELDARAAALAQREILLAGAEKRLSTRLDEMTVLQHRLEELEAARRDRDEASWRGLVKTYEAMKPRDAAAIFNDLDPDVLLPVVDRMREAKTAPILAAMLPDRARLLTAGLAQRRLKANASDSTPPQPAR